MTDKERARKNLNDLLNFVENAPENEKIISMDCNEHCENMSRLAEQVADGADLDDVLPELKEYMQFWGDCREEFIALVNVLKAEMMDELPEFEDEL